MPVRWVLGVFRLLLRDLLTPVGRGSPASRGARGTLRPCCSSCPRCRGRPSRLQPDPRPGAGGTCPAGPRRSALPPILPGLRRAPPGRGVGSRAWRRWPLSPWVTRGPPCRVRADRAAGGRGRTAGPWPAACAGLGHCARCVWCLAPVRQVKL